MPSSCPPVSYAIPGQVTGMAAEGRLKVMWVDGSEQEVDRLEVCVVCLNVVWCVGVCLWALHPGARACGVYRTPNVCPVRDVCFAGTFGLESYV